MKSKDDKSFREQEKQSVSNQPAAAAAAKVAGLLEKASVHHTAGQLAEAEVLYREILEVSPDHPDALHLLGVIAYQVGQHELALQLIDQAIKTRQGFVEAYFSRGNVLYALKRYHEAIESFDKTIELRPLYAEAYNNRGGALHALKRYEEALECFEKALLLKPDDLDSRSNRGAALREFALQQAALAPPGKERVQRQRPGFLLRSHHGGLESPTRPEKKGLGDRRRP